MKPDQPSDLELQILSALWRLEPVPVRKLLEELPDGKKRAYTTVLSALQVMEKKKLVTRERDGKTDQWSSAVTQDEILGSQVDRLVDHGFNGRPSSLLQCLLDRKIEPDELDAINELLELYRKQSTTEPK